MKKMNRLKKIVGGAAFAVFGLCVLATNPVFGQKQCYVRDTGGVQFQIEIAGAKPMKFADTPDCKAAVGSLRSAGLLIYGIELKPNDKSDDQTILSWMNEIAEKPIWRTKFNEGFTAADGMNFLKERFAAAGDLWIGVFLDRVTGEIYGRPALKIEKDYYVPRLAGQKETYASIFLAEKNKLNKTAAERKQMIDRAYTETMGRSAAESELKYWQPRSEIYKEIIPAGREWLYSPGGAKDLRETVTRAYQVKYKNSPVVESRIVKLMADYTPAKLIYAEMIKK